MRSNPFPGMNPFLQASWGDIHLYLLALMRKALSEELPPDLSVRAEEFVAVTDSSQHYCSDLAIVDSWRSGFPPMWVPEDKSSPRLAATEPIIVLTEPETERWLEIRAALGQLITVIELLSPTIKGEEDLRNIGGNRGTIFRLAST